MGRSFLGKFAAKQNFYLKCTNSTLKEKVAVLTKKFPKNFDPWKNTSERCIFKGNHHVCSWKIPGGHHIRFGSEILCRFSYRLASSGSPKHKFSGTYVNVVPLTKILAWVQKTVIPYSRVPSRLMSYMIRSCAVLYCMISLSLNQIAISRSASETASEQWTRFLTARVSNEACPYESIV